VFAARDDGSFDAFATMPGDAFHIEDSEPHIAQL
jgi:hypothetical protein